MIVRVDGTRRGPSPELSVPLSPGRSAAFGRINLLQLRSVDLQEQLGITFMEREVHSAFELAPALRGAGELRVNTPIRNNLLVRLIDRRAFLLPCFVGHQQLGADMLPFMTDGPSGTWSLFFGAKGEFMLVRCDGDRLSLAHFEPAPQAPVAPAPVLAIRSVGSYLKSRLPFGSAG